MRVIVAIFYSAGTLAEAKLQFIITRTHILSKTVSGGSSRQDVELEFTIRSL